MGGGSQFQDVGPFSRNGVMRSPKLKDEDLLGRWHSFDPALVGEWVERETAGVPREGSRLQGYYTKFEVSHASYCMHQEPLSSTLVHRVVK